MANQRSYSHLILIYILFLFSLSSKYATTSPTRKLPKFLARFSNHNKPLQKYRYETRYFDQTLDHFSFANLPKFQQRYLISFEHWAGPAKAGPIFFYCGNEGYIDWFAENTGFVWEIAPRFGALVLFPEVITSPLYIINCFLMNTQMKSSSTTHIL